MLYVVPVSAPRIEQPNIEVHGILHILGHEDQLMLNGYHCDLGTVCGWGTSGKIAVS